MSEIKIGEHLKYRKKPVVIEAIPVYQALRLAKHDWYQMPKWLRDAYEKGDIIFVDEYVLIHTLEGTHRGDNRDYIIQGVKGELYPIKPDIFQQTYEPVDAPMCESDDN